MRLHIYFALAALLGIYSDTVAQGIMPTADMNTKRIFHQSQLLPNGKVLVFGGQTTNTTLQPVTHASCEIYDPSTATWTAAASMNHARRNHASVVTQAGKILAIGGDSNTHDQMTVESYDPQNDTWTLVGTLQKARKEGEAILLDNGDVLVVSSYPSSFEVGSSDGSSWTEHSVPNIWRIPEMPRVIRMSDTRLLVAGSHPSFTTNPGVTITQALAVDTTVNRMPVNRPGAGLALLQNGKVLVTGGNSGGTNDLFDPATNTFSPAGNFNNGHVVSPLVKMASGKVAVADMGVLGSDQEILEVYDPVNNSWQIVFGHNFYATGNYRRTALGNGKHLLSGGLEYMQLTTTGSRKAFIFDENGWPAAIADNRKLDAAIYYVSSSRELVIDLNTGDHSSCDAVVYNSIGQVMQRYQPAQMKTKLPLSGLPAGMYVAFVSQGGNTQTHKFIID